jgi:MoxR-like ATPase
MPGDITGSLVFDARTSEFSFREGPVFTNLLLADEINRTPPKTQAALLEAMEERQVSVDGTPVRCRRRSSWPRPRTRSSTRAPTRCPRPSSTASCSRSCCPVPPRDQEIEVCARHAAGFDPRDLSRWDPHPSPAQPTSRRVPRRCAQGGRSLPRSRHTSSTSPARRQSPRRCRWASPHAAPPRCWRRARAWAWLNGRTLRHPRRRQGPRPRDPGAPAHPAPRGRARRRRRRLGARHRHRLGARPPLMVDRTSRP